MSWLDFSAFVFLVLFFPKIKIGEWFEVKGMVIALIEGGL